MLAEPKKQRGTRHGGGGDRAAEEPPPPRRRSWFEPQAVIPIPVARSPFYVADAMRAGISNEDIHDLTKIDPWFLAQISRIVKAEERMVRGDLGPAALRSFKRLGFSDAQIGELTGSCADDVRALRKARGEGGPGLRARRYVRRRVRGAHAVPLFDVRDRERGEARRVEEEGGDPRRRPEPHRAGHRVRLLLRARRRWRCASSGSRP